MTTTNASTAAPPSPYRMTISLNVLEDLGIGLYSNVPAVLAEMVANAWDAEASIVQISIDVDARSVEVSDNGNGMTLEDINSRFLRVGYDKRAEFGDETGNLHRKVMGRKGIGKLSCFSVANSVDVVTTKNGEKHALRMSREDIRRAVERENPSDSGEYRPTDIRAEMPADFERGTKLVLRGFDNRLNWTETYLRRRLARRFSIIGPRHGFQVSVNGKRIGPTDREFYSKIQFIWYAGDEGRDAAKQCVNLEREEKVSWSIDRLEGDSAGAPYAVTGWIGTVKKPEDLGDDNNTITIFAKGKVVQEDILKDIKEARVFAEYLIGELNAEFLDDSDRSDIVTSDRQRLKETDPRYDALKKLVEREVRGIGNRWDDLRIAGSEKYALELPAVKEWYQRLREEQRGAAKKMFGRIESLKLPSEEARKELYRASILAFERLEYKGLLASVGAFAPGVKKDGLDDLFRRVDALERAHYYQIVTGRLAILDKIRDVGKASPEWKESVVRKYLSAHPWMLDPAWERASEDDGVQAKLEAKRRLEKGQTALRYLRSAGVHLLLDLRTEAEPIDPAELERAAAIAVEDVRSVIRADPDDPEPVHVVILMPSRPRGRQKSRGTLDTGVRGSIAQFMTYDEMVDRAIGVYAGFIKRQPRESEIVEMMERFERDLDAHRPQVPAEP